MSVINNTANVVIVGAGPVGLWTAVQTKINNKDAEIVVLEKYEKYKRSHVLKIESSSLPWLFSSSPLYPLVQDLKKKKVVPTNEIEGKLKDLAHKLGIKILIQNVTDPNELPKQFPKAKVFVGADGSHSVMRGKVCDNKFSIEKTLNYVAEVKYQVQGKATKAYPLVKARINNIIKTFGQEHIGRRNLATDTTPVTLRIFINEKTYNQLKDEATFKTPLKLRSNVRPVDISLLQHIQKWLDIKKEVYEENRVKGSENITVTHLGYYVSDKFVRRENDITWCLVGDAAFGVPFFRSLNNGFLCGTKLAKYIGRSLEPNQSKVFTKNSAKDWDRYSNYVSLLAKKEVYVASIKSRFINFYIFAIRTLGINSDRLKSWTDSGWVKLKPAKAA